MDGVYSAFIDPELAEVLMTPHPSPLKAWEEAHPGEDSSQATVREVLEASESTDWEGATP